MLSGAASLGARPKAGCDPVAGVGRRVRNVQTGAISAYLYVVILGVLGGALLYWSWAAAS